MGKLMNKMKEQLLEELQPSIDNLKKSAPGLFYSQKELIAQHTEKYKYDNYFVIKYEYIYNLITSTDIYYIYNLNDELVYTVKGKFWFGTYRLDLLQNDEVIGTIRKRFITFPDILEGIYKLRICTLKIRDNSPYQVRTYKDCGERRFKIKRKSWSLRSNENQDIYSLTINKLKVAHINKLSDEKWLLGFNDTEKELDFIMIAAALRNMLRE